MLVEGVLFITVVVAIVFITLQFIGGNASYQGDKAIYNLSKPNQQVLTNLNLPWNPSPSTLRFGIFVESAPKTVGKVDCIYGSPTLSFAPDCLDYSYKPCACASLDCSRCSLGPNSFMFQLLGISDNLQLWASGYTNQNDKPYVPAFLKIRTGNSPTQHFMESIPLPAIPLQRWTIITIVKEGRRFDVYYGTNLVISQLCQYVPISPSQSMNWTAGNVNWHGQIGFFNGSQTMSSKDDVKKDVETLVNTRGIPYYIDQVKFDFTSFSMPTSCILGNCNTLPAVKPMNPFVSYASSVS